MNLIFTLQISIIGIILGTGFVRAQSINITEINYNSDSTLNSGDWVELYNPGPNPVNLGGWRLRDGDPLHLYLIPAGIVIQPSGYYVFCADTQRFDNIYSITNRKGNMGFGFNNHADTIKLYNASNVLQLEVRYIDTLPFPQGADGYGRTLTLKGPTLDPTDTLNWGTGCIGGSPGAATTPCTAETLVISEINYKSSTTADAGDWFELHNLSGQTVDISGWKVRDSDNQNIFTIPNGTQLASKGFLVLYNTPQLFNVQHPGIFNKAGPFLFGLDGDGEAIRVYNAQDKIVFSVFYDDDAGWPNGPDGAGYTLEADTNFAFARDVCAPTSWFEGCLKGSPGRKYNPDCFAGTVNFDGSTPLEIFPNPSAGNLSIETGIQDPLFIKIYSATGQVCYQHAYYPGQTLGVDIPQGLYWVAIYAGDVQITIKPWVKTG